MRAHTQQGLTLWWTVDILAGNEQQKIIEQGDTCISLVMLNGHPNSSSKMKSKRHFQKSDIDIDIGRDMNKMKIRVSLKIDALTGDSCSDWEADPQSEFPIGFQLSQAPIREPHPR